VILSQPLAKNASSRWVIYKTSALFAAVSERVVEPFFKRRTAMHFAKYSLFPVAGVVAGLLTAPTGAATIYTNDLGTMVQQNALGEEVLQTPASETRADHYPDLAPPNAYPYVDLDGDTLVNNAKITGGVAQTYLYKNYYAPVYKTISTPMVSALGSGFVDDYNSGAGVRITRTGAATYSQNLSGNVTPNAPQVLQATTGSDVNYQRIMQFQAAMRLYSLSGSEPDIWRTPRVGDMSVSATVNDAAVGDNVYIYKNDFGTESQISDFTLTGQAVTTSDAPLTDNDQDNLGGRLAGETTSPFITTLIRQINAPAGTVFSNPVFTALAYGDTGNWGSNVTIALSADGVNFNDVSAVTGTGPSSFNLVADSSGNGAFDNLTTVWAEIRLYAGNNGGARPWIENVLVSADVTAVPEPASMGLLLVGGAMMLRRRRK
jgi:hypothetical protein